MTTRAGLGERLRTAPVFEESGGESLGEQVESERQEVVKLAKEGMQALRGYVYGGPLGYVLGRMGDGDHGKLADIVRAQAARETDIYARAAVYGEAFDPLGDDLGEMRVNGRKIRVEKTGQDNPILIQGWEGWKQVLGYADPERLEAVVGANGGKLGFKKIVEDVLLSRLDDRGQGATAAHEFAHLGALPNSTRAEQRKRAVITALTQLYLLDLVAGSIYSKDERFSDAAIQLQQNMLWRIMDETVARVAQSDFGYCGMISNDGIKDELEAYYPDEIGILDSYIDGVAVRARALSGLGLPGWEVARKATKRAMETGLGKPDSVVGEEEIIRIFDYLIAEEMGLPDGKVDKRSIDEMADRASELADLRHLKLQRIVLETAINITEQEWGEEEVRMLRYGDDENVRLIYLDGNLMPGGQRLAVKVADQQIILTKFNKNLVEPGWTKFENRTKFFDEVVDDEKVGVVAGDFWKALDKEQKQQLVQILKQGGVPKFGSEVDLSRGRVAAEIWGRVIDYWEPVQADEYRRQLATRIIDYDQKQLNDYLIGQEQTRFLGTVDALPRVSYGSLAAFDARVRNDLSEEWEREIFKRVAEQPRLEARVEKMWPNWKQQQTLRSAFLSAVAGREFFMRDIINSDLGRENYYNRLMALVGKVSSGGGDREAVVICELVKIMATVYSELI